MIEGVNDDVTEGVGVLLGVNDGVLVPDALFVGVIEGVNDDVTEGVGVLLGVNDAVADAVYMEEGVTS